MDVVRARVLGYCMGVRRAVEAAERALEANGRERKQIFTLGPLIHNPSVLRQLEARGVKVLSIEESDGIDAESVVIIRAHGTTPQVLQQLTERRASVIDATCPRVHLSQKRAREWSQKGYAVIIAGDRNHGEVTSIAGFADTAFVVQSEADAAELDVPERAILIAQTTFSPADFERIAAVLLEKNPSLRVFNSICSATLERQQALKELLGTVDGVLVIGGRNSANTRRLWETASSRCAAVALIEDVSQIPPSFSTLPRVGITAGASTPDSAIDAVEEYCRGLK